MPSNAAAWITEKKGKPLVVREAPYTAPGHDEVVVKNGAVAINPVDWKIQDEGYFIEEFPNILGCDVAGEVVEVGDGVDDLKPGQRVLGHPPSLLTHKIPNAGFQLYTLLPRTFICPIPDSLSYSAATVLPLGVSTASAGLFQKEFLGLTLPTLSPKPAGATVLVWGGSSSVGSCAIQLAVHSGYEVFATASKRNTEYCKKLGAAQVFDHSSADVVDEVVKALKGKKLAGIYDSISLPETLKPCVEIASSSEGAKKVASTLPGTDQHSAKNVEVKPVFALTILHNEVGPAIYRDFLPQALAKGSFHAKPDPVVAGHGLESVQAGLDKQKAGVSAGKVVVTL